LAYSAATLWLPVSNPIAIDMGAQPLKPEKSVNYSAGFVLRPTSKASVTVDFYRIDISDQILPIDAITGSFLTSELTKLGVANASAISSLRYFANAISDRTQGINIVGRDSWDFGWLGQLSGTVALNYNNVAVTKVNPNPSVLPSTVTIAGPVTIGYVEHWAPDSKWVATLTYTKGPWEVFLTETRYGRWDFVSPQAALDQTFGFQWVTNLAITRTVMKNVRLTFGANNLFNTYPTEAILADTYSNANKCDLQAQEGCQGGYWYGRLDYRF
jgi:iron complex outermembrane receptor protein